MKKIKELSIKNRLFLSISVCIVIFMTAFWLLITNLLEEYLTHQTVESSEDRFAVMEQGIQFIYDTTEEYIRMMSQDIRLQEGMYQYKYHKYENLTEEKNKINSIASKTFSSVVLTKQLVGAALLDDEGKLIFAGPDLTKTDIIGNISEECCVQTREKSKPVWGNELLVLSDSWRAKQYHVLPIYKVLRNTNSGEFLGYMILFVNEEAFFDLYEKTSLFQDSRYYLVNEKNKILSTSDRALLNCQLSENLNWLLEKDVSELQLEKEPALYISTKSGSGSEKLLHIISMENLVEQKNDLWMIAIGTMVVMILLLCFTVWSISSKITKPIVLLTNVMRNIENESDMSVRVNNTFYGEMAILTKVFNDLMNKLQKALSDTYRKQKEKRKLELLLLQEQMNPHFLYNTLETISSLLMLGMENKAIQVCNDLSEFYKLSLSKGKEIITLEDELRIVEDYLRIQSIRYVEYMEYSVECEEIILDCYVPKLLIQPIVENSIYHGLKKQKKKGLLLVSGRSDEAANKIILEIIDTGNGIEDERLEKIRKSIEEGEKNTASFGISNVATRLKALFGEEATIDVTSTVGVATSVQMEFPMIRCGETLFWQEWENKDEGIDYR